MKKLNFQNSLHLMLCFLLAFTGFKTKAQWKELGGAGSSGWAVTATAVDKNGNVYAAGRNTNSNSHTFVAKWTATTNSWAELGGVDAMYSQINGLQPTGLGATCVATDDIGNVYVAGYYYVAGHTYNVFKFNGTKWSEVGGLGSLDAFNNHGGGEAIQTLKVLPDGKIFVNVYSDKTNSLGSISLPDIAVFTPTSPGSDNGSWTSLSSIYNLTNSLNGGQFVAHDNIYASYQMKFTLSQKNGELMASGHPQGINEASVATFVPNITNCDKTFYTLTYSWKHLGGTACTGAPPDASDPGHALISMVITDAGEKFGRVSNSGKFVKFDGTNWVIIPRPTQLQGAIGFGQYSLICTDGTDVYADFQVDAFNSGIFKFTVATGQWSLLGSLSDAIGYSLTSLSTRNGKIYVSNYGFGGGKVSTLDLPAITWTGTTSSNWSVPTNWSGSIVPNANTNVIIPTGVARQPSLSANIAVAGITLNGSINLNGKKLTINGALTGSGKLKGSSTSSLEIAGNVGNLLFDAANNSLADLTINGTATLGSAIDIYGMLMPNNGTLSTNDLLTLKSVSILQSAFIGQVGSIANINGNVTVERYIPKGFRGYRDISPAVANAGSMFKNWQESGASTSGTGVFITGEVGSSKGYNSNTGIDYSLNGTNPASFFNNSVALSNWTIITNTKTTNLDPYQPYRVLVRGDRSFDMFAVLPILGTNGNTGMVNGTAIRATGRLITGNVVYSTTGVSNSVYNSSIVKLNGSSTSALSAIANPYVCPVDLSQVSATGIEGNGTSINKFYYFDPTYSSTGKYVVVLNGVKNVSLSNVNNILQPGQSIFVRNNASTTPTITFTESAKVTNTTQTAVFGVNSINRMDFTLLIKLSTDSIYSLTDGAVSVFKAGYSNGYNSNEDAAKLNNANDNISIIHGNVNLSINGRALATANDSIVLKLVSLSTKNYQLQVDGSSFSANGLTAYLYDAYLKTSTALTAGLNKVNFIVDNTVAASYANRFGVVFKPTAPLSVKAIYATATLKNEIATINWNTQGEEKVATYTVEKSIDAKNFNKVGEVVVAKNSATASYSATDKNIANGNTYFRIKATNLDASVQYSNISKLSTYNLELSTYNLYPNPLKGKALTIQMNNVVVGKYTVVIYNALGQKLVNQVVVHEGGIANHAINIGTQLSAGVYTVSILGSEGKVIEMKLSVE